MEKNFPENLLYTKEHEWCHIDGEVATIGITWHAQDALGDIVYCELPEVGDSVTEGEAFGVVESVKAVSDLFSPVTGEVIERNDDILEAPEGLNDDTYDDGWMLRVRMTDRNTPTSLMTREAYEKYLAEESD